MTTRLYRVILPVPDVERARRFYDTLFGRPGERVSPGRHYYALGGAVLALYDPVADGDALGGGWSHHANQYLYFAVDDLEAALLRAKQGGATIDGAITTMPWGERLFYARDPFGHPICLVDDRTLFTGSATLDG